MTIELDPQTILVAYRGTDGSMVGLNEDVDMSYQPEIFGQSVAADYLDKIAQTYPDKQIYTTGHSKGGNFAAYAISAVSPKIQDQIIKAYSFDGPGFMKETYDQLEFQRAIPKMITYVPEGSIFGMMLDHPERVIVVKSKMKHLMQQHNPFIGKLLEIASLWLLVSAMLAELLEVHLFPGIQKFHVKNVKSSGLLSLLL